ncbi:MAG: methionine adenosyltransferase [Micromonosporaceae bacterium]
MIERKGRGHPDTLADQLAEALSRAYSKFTLNTVGAVLHHNFDKLALLGGASEVRYGGGRMLQPVRVLVNGRATRSCGSERIPVDELVVDTVHRFFRERLPALRDHLRVELNITSNSSPGAVHTEGGPPERTSWFSPGKVGQLQEHRALLANDTSLGTGWAPLSPVERFVIRLADDLSGPSEFRRSRSWCGSDVKVMALADSERIDVVFCSPQCSPYVKERAAYLANRDEVLAYATKLAGELLPDHEASFRINARDIVERDELYLTYTGSSIESGDEGVVGRGNRVNGLITPLRPMNLEGANGKNPVYHVGKPYNVAAGRIAQRLHERFGGYAEVHLVSATGQLLAYPWQTLVRMTCGDASEEQVHAVAREVLDAFPQLTTELVDGSVSMA